MDGGRACGGEDLRTPRPPSEGQDAGFCSKRALQARSSRAVLDTGKDPGLQPREYFFKCCRMENPVPQKLEREVSPGPCSPHHPECGIRGHRGPHYTVHGESHCRSPTASIPGEPPSRAVSGPRPPPGAWRCEWVLTCPPGPTLRLNLAPSRELRVGSREALAGRIRFLPQAHPAAPGPPPSPPPSIPSRPLGVTEWPREESVCLLSFCSPPPGPFTAVDTSSRSLGFPSWSPPQGCPVESLRLGAVRGHVSPGSCSDPDGDDGYCRRQPAPEHSLPD